MLTFITQTAIAILTDISRKGSPACAKQQYTAYPRLSELLSLLEAGGLICLLPGHDSSSVSSYRLSRPVTEISLLDILQATGEHVNCDLPLGEKYYLKYGATAHKLGILNSVMRNLLSNIRLNDL